MRQKSKTFQIIVIAAAIVILAVVLGVIYRDNSKREVQIISSNDTSAARDTSEQPQESGQSETVRVHVAGHVKNPGVYEAPSDYRVIDVIELAGGETDDAYLDAINLAAKIKDAERIYVPSADEKDSYASVSAADSLVNINTASHTELKTLPGIGDARASDIINYRENNGGFESIRDIMNVPGIGDGTFTRIESLITT